MDLRAEPIVLCMPKIEKSRYYDVQVVDMYTFNFGYMGSRTTGNDAGCYMIAGPDWKGETPKGINNAFQSETQFGLIGYRTQLFGPSDMPNVKKIQAGYKVQTLSQFLKQPAPPAAPAIDFPPFTKDDMKLPFLKFLNFVLQFCPPNNDEEKAARAKLAEIGIGAGQPFDLDKLSEARKAEEALGVKEGYDSIVDKKDNIGKNINGWLVAAALGNRAFFHGNWLLRAAGALAGIYGNSAEEAVYPLAKNDNTGAALDGSKHNYTLTFAAGQYPPVNAFWSVTMYEGKTPVADREPDQSLSHQLADASRHEEEPGRLTDDLHPEGRAGGGQESQLAACSRWPDLHGDAALLAERDAAIDPASGQRHMAAPGDNGRKISRARHDELQALMVI